MEVEFVEQDFRAAKVVSKRISSISKRPLAIGSAVLKMPAAQWTPFQHKSSTRCRRWRTGDPQMQSGPQFAARWWLDSGEGGI
jgi:hypothetical protein